MRLRESRFRSRAERSLGNRHGFDRCLRIAVASKTASSEEASLVIN